MEISRDMEKCWSRLEGRAPYSEEVTSESMSRLARRCSTTDDVIFQRPKIVKTFYIIYSRMCK